MMPGLSGYDVCRKIRASEATALLPVVLCTSLDPKQERVNGIEAGADDFIPKPINQPELFARVKSLLRIKALQDEVKAKTAQLAEWNITLEERVREQVAQIERLAPAEALLLAAAGRGHRQRRRRRPAEEPPARDHRGLPRPARLHRLHRDRRPRGGDGRAARVPRRDGRADRRPRRHARAFHRRRHHGLLQRPGGGRRPGRPRGAHGAADAAAHGHLGRRLEAPRLRPEARRRHRHGLRHDRRHRLRRPHRLRRDRQRHQPGGAAVRRGGRRRDPARAARGGGAGRGRRGRAGGRVQPEGAGAADCGVASRLRPPAPPPCAAARR